MHTHMFSHCLFPAFCTLQSCQRRLASSDGCKAILAGTSLPITRQVRHDHSPHPRARHAHTPTHTHAQVHEHTRTRLPVREHTRTHTSMCRVAARATANTAHACTRAMGSPSLTEKSLVCLVPRKRYAASRPTKSIKGAGAGAEILPRRGTRKAVHSESAAAPVTGFPAMTSRHGCRIALCTRWQPARRRRPLPHPSEYARAQSSCNQQAAQIAARFSRGAIGIC